MAKPSTVTLRMPKELKNRLEIAAEQQGVSLNQFALYILSGEVTRLEMVEEQTWKELEKKYYADDSNEVIREKALKVLNKASKNSDLPEWDRVP